MWQHCGIRMFIIERDIYARQAIASYLAWDRRTHVIGMAASHYEMIAALHEEYEEIPRLDAVTLNADMVTNPSELAGQIKLIRHYTGGAEIVCLTSRIDLGMVLAARQAGGAAFLSRETVGLGVAGAVEFVLTHDFTVTEDIAHALENYLTGDLSVMPGRRQYNRLTPRIEQALWLCVIEGLPAELAAEEMGVSISTVRSYIKEGYRILESEDDTAYPVSASPAERAFRRFTALEEDEMILQTHMPWRPAA